MFYKTELQSNNTDLHTILDMVNGLPEASSGVELPELTNPADAAQILSGYEAIDENGEVVTGTIATKTSSDLTASGPTVTVPAGYYASQATKSVSTVKLATPSISIDSSTGEITASVTQTSGYVSASATSRNKQLTTQAAKTVTPSTSSQIAVGSGKYTIGAVTVAGDSNLKAENIKSGVSIFGVDGSYIVNDFITTRVEDFTFSYNSSSYTITITIPIGVQISKVVYLNGFVFGSSLRNGFVYPDYYSSADGTPSFFIPYAYNSILYGLTLPKTNYTITISGTNIIVSLNLGKSHPNITTDMSSGRFTVGYVPA